MSGEQPATLWGSEGSCRESSAIGAQEHLREARGIWEAESQLLSIRESSL